MLINCSPCVQQAQLGYREEAYLPQYLSLSSVTGAEEVAAFLLCQAQVQQTPAWVASVYLILPLGTQVQCLLNVPLRLIVVYFQFLAPLCHSFWQQGCSRNSRIRDTEQGLPRTISILVTGYVIWCPPVCHYILHLPLTGFLLDHPIPEPTKNHYFPTTFLEGGVFHNMIALKAKKLLISSLDIHVDSSSCLI